MHFPSGSKIQLLTGHEIRQEVRRIATRPGRLMVAVAYWGPDAVSRTGLDTKSDPRRPKSVQILCDLSKGFCDPQQIVELQQLDGVCVRHLKGLHAKVWVNGDSVVLGSANASAGGLPTMAEPRSDKKLETAVLCLDARLAEDISTWFQGRWADAKDVTDDDLIEAEKQRRGLKQTQVRWESRNRDIRSVVQHDLDDAQFSARFSGLQLVVYPDLSPSQRATDWLGMEAPAERTTIVRENTLEAYPFFEWGRAKPQWSHGPGTSLAAVRCSPATGECTFEGFWEVRHCPSVDLEDTQLTLLERMESFNGHALAEAMQNYLCGIVAWDVAERRFNTDDFGFCVDMPFVAFWEAVRERLKRRLVDEVVDRAQRLCLAQEFSEVLTSDALELCRNDENWWRDYQWFVGPERFFKDQVHSVFGKSVRKGVFADNKCSPSGREMRRAVSNEITQTCTLFESWPDESDRNERIRNLRSGPSPGER